MKWVYATSIIRVQRAHVAQVAERVLGKDKVTGSNPVVGSIRLARRLAGWLMVFDQLRARRMPCPSTPLRAP